MKIALILGPGALCGAYGAGIASVLGKHIYFDKIYGCSVGVFAATFAATEQFDIMLDVWRNHVHGRLLINFRNPFRGRNILDLEYLNGLFQKYPFLLDLGSVSAQSERLVHVLTHYVTDEAVYFSPGDDNIFVSMSASSAVPYIHPAVKINDTYFYDGALSDPLPLLRALDDGNDTVIVVSNFSMNDGYEPITRLSRLAIQTAKKFKEGISLVESKSIDNPNIFLLRPSSQILKSPVDTDKTRINQAIDMGIRDAEIFLKNYEAL